MVSEVVYEHLESVNVCVVLNSTSESLTQLRSEIPLQLDTRDVTAGITLLMKCKLYEANYLWWGPSKPFTKTIHTHYGSTDIPSMQDLSASAIRPGCAVLIAFSSL